jgi:HEPN domain-containing protein
MNTEQRLNQVADRYREQGYQVVLNPRPDDLPPFAKDFKVEILASRPDGNVLASAKGSSAEFEADPNLSRYAEVIEKRPGWRYDVFVLGPPPAVPDRGDISEALQEETYKALDNAERLIQAGFGAPAVLTAWAALESAMRQRLRSLGSKAEWGTSPRSMLNELISSGILTHSEFRELEGLSRLRNIIAHGFSVPEISPSSVSFLVDTARKLLNESKQLAPAL